MTVSRADIEAAVRGNYETQREAMVAGDVGWLGALLADDFTLTHMTGCEQPKTAWLTGASPVLTARTQTKATSWGGPGTWPLQLEIHYTAEGDRWLATYTLASTWR